MKKKILNYNIRKVEVVLMKVLTITQYLMDLEIYIILVNTFIYL